MDIVFVTTAKSNEEAKSLLKGFWNAFQELRRTYGKEKYDSKKQKNT